MGVWSNIFPYLWNYRYRLLAVLLLSWVVAFLWGANLSAAFPAVKILLEGESVAEYVEKQIAETESELDIQSERVESLESNTESTRMLRKQAREQEKLSESSFKLMILRWTQRNLIPILPTDAFDLYAVVIVLFITGTVLKGIGVVFQETIGWSVVHGIVNEIREDSLSHLMSLDYGTLSRRGNHDLLSRLTFDLQVFSYGLSALVARSIREPLKIGVCITLAFIVNWRLTLLCFFVVPILAGLFSAMGRQFKKATRRKLEYVSRMQQTLEESFNGLKVVLVDNGQERQIEQFAEHNESYFRKATRLARLSAMMKPLTEAFAFAAVMLALLPGAWLVIHDGTHFLGVRLSDSTMDLARLSVLYALLAGCLDPLRKLSDMFSSLKRSSSAAERVFELCEIQSSQQTPQLPKSLPTPFSELRIHEVSFTYPVGIEGTVRPPVLTDISVEIQSGEVVCFVGPNGCGKSTLLSLISRLYDPVEGEIRIDGVDLTEVPPADLRARIGFVTQDTRLIRGSIIDNITYGMPHATSRQIDEAAQLAGVTPFLPKLPHGLHSEVGEGGSQLSGGQRQRVALARAILRDPSLLLLDEATAAVDANSARQIESSLADIRKGRTLLIVTHSISEELLALNPRFVVLQHGRIVADGQHDALLKSCPLFASLFARQESRSA